MAGCSGEIQAAPSATASLEAFTLATPTYTATPWVATPRETVELEPSPTPFVHVVTKGDTLLGIAIKYGVELDQLLAANPDIDPHFLSVGQSLFIPGPNGQPIQSLLPTSTPVPLLVSTTQCYDTPSEQLICLVTVSNVSDTAVEAVSGLITLLGSTGDTLDTHLAFAPLNLLPPGGEMPLSTAFDAWEGKLTGARTEIRSAVEAQTPSERYLETDVSQLNVSFSGSRTHASMEGVLDVAASSEAGEWREAVLAIAYDATGAMVGFAKWESGPDPIHEAHQAFSVDVFSLGPSIDRIETMSEARLFNPIIQTPSPAP